MATIQLATKVTTASPDLATLPLFEPDVTYSLPTGQTHYANDSTEFNNLLTGVAVDGKTLARGDVIVLDAGVTYTPTGSTFPIPALGGAGWVYVISSAMASLPAAGVRVAPSDAANMPKIVANGGGGAGYSAFSVVDNSKYFRFVGIEISASASYFTYSLNDMTSGTTVEANLPEYIYFDRCYIHGDATLGARSGVNLGGKNMAVINCYVSGFKDPSPNTGDTQAVRVGDGIGGHLIQNNYLEGGGENFISGGNDPSNLAWVAADVTIRGNHFYKPLAWQAAGLTIKNHLELKWAKRYLIERNFFENCWPEDQEHSFNIAEINQSGNHTAAEVSDITVRWNKWDHVDSVLTTCWRNCAGGPYVDSVHGQRFLFENNLATNINRSVTSGYCIPMRVGSQPNGVYYLHNTFIATGASAPQAALQVTGFPGAYVRVENNLMWNGTYGISVDGGGPVEDFWDNWTLAKNIFIGGSPGGGGLSPDTNYYPADEAAVGFVGGGDYTLSGGSAYKNAGTDGLDVGCTNVALVEAYATAAINGTAS